jgi:MFS family permease
LVAGTAIPYGIRWLGLELPWRATVLTASACAIAGGLVVLLLPLGPHLRARAAFAPRMIWRVFTDPAFRANSFGYFGHMWELYALWSLIAFPLQAALGDTTAVPLLAFLVVASGVVGCVGGGWLSRRIGERRTALLALIGSACACLVSGWLFACPPWLLIPCLLLWGVLVVADSPQFSALAARLCPPEYTATALTIQNGIGFAITVLSIQCVAWTAELVGWRWAFLLLAPGPLLGAAAMIRLGRLVPSTLAGPP